MTFKLLKIVLLFLTYVWYSGEKIFPEELLMEPVTLSAGAIATLLLTKMIEKLGEEIGQKLPDLGNKALEKIGSLKQLLWRKAPETASAIERVTYHPELVEQQPEDYGIDVLTKKMELAAKEDTEVAEVIELIAKEVRPMLSPEFVQEMAVGIRVKGNLKAGNMTQEANQKTTGQQTMLKDIEAGGDITIGDLTQKG
ncbi:hypothetical protein [Dolichospermum flos-aquae]|nr:hypothetical protein [Dolichospermum flos-aquae]